MRTYITRSKSGHYTATIKEEGRTLAKSRLVSSKERARMDAESMAACIKEGRHPREGVHFGVFSGV